MPFARPHLYLAIVACAARPLAAQAADPARVESAWSALSVGPFLPAGDLWGVAHVGFSVSALAGYAPPRFPLGVRAEAAFASTSLRTMRSPDQSATGDLVLYSASLAPLVYVKHGANLHPYVFASAGIGRARLTGVDSLDGKDVPDRVVSRPIFGAGVGVRLRRGGLGGFIEARYQRMSLPGALQFLPLIIGLEL